jgi:hypothetical protein
MIEVTISYGCHWGEDGHVRAWPMRLTFGAVGHEVTVDDMLKGRGHAVLRLDQLVALVRGLAGLDMPIELIGAAPAELLPLLVEAGYSVKTC